MPGAVVEFVVSFLFIFFFPGERTSVILVVQMNTLKCAFAFIAYPSALCHTSILCDQMLAMTVSLWWNRSYIIRF